jgi:hypothetical protein
MASRRKKYTRAMYVRAKKALSEVSIHEETLRVWTTAVEQIGIDDEERVVALEVTDDGGIKVELAPLSREEPTVGLLGSKATANHTADSDSQDDMEAC